MRDLLWRCDEHRGPDADFPAVRGYDGARVTLRSSAGVELESGDSEVTVGECRDTCIVGIAIVGAWATAALEFVPDTTEVHLLRVNPPRCSVAMVSETPSPVWARMVLSI